MARPKSDTPEGREAIAKCRRSMIKKYGSEQAYRAAMSVNGKKGGSVPHPETRTFTTHGKEWVSKCGQKGGTISSRAQDKVSLEERQRQYQLKRKDLQQ